jgi:glycosyltransferase involved in cell wall biosynthesis
MRILQCVTTLDPRVGGSVEAGRQLTIGMLRQGHDVEVVTLDKPEEKDDKQAERGWPCTIHRLGPTYSYYLYSRRLVPWLIANAGRYDAIVVHNMYRHIGYGVWKATRVTGSRYFLFTHGMLDPWFKTLSLKHLKKSLFWKLAGRRMLRDATAVLYTAEDEKELAPQSFSPYECNERIVGLGIDDPAASLGMDIERFREIAKVPAKKGYVLFLGRITAKKRVDLLIRGFAAAFRDDSTSLVIAGPEDAGLKRQLSGLPEAMQLGDRLIWTGHLDGEEKWGAIAGASAMALTSHTENFGIALVEALAMGVPVLTTNKVNIWREIESGGAGFVENDDLEGATRLLGRWRSTNPAVKLEMRENARKVFTECFDINRVSAKLVAVMSEGQPCG